MSEIVVAYARADQGRAAHVIKKLESLGFTVRRDEAGKAVGGRRKTAKGVAPRVVLLSRHYPAARVRGASLAARLDAAPLPSIMKAPSVDLRAWRGRDDHRGWKKLTARVRAVAGAPAGKDARKQIKAPRGKAAAKKSGVGPALFWMTGAAAAVAGGVVVFMTMH